MLSVSRIAWRFCQTVRRRKSLRSCERYPMPRRARSVPSEDALNVVGVEGYRPAVGAHHAMIMRKVLVLRRRVSAEDADDLLLRQDES